MEIVWDLSALDQLAGFLKNDPRGVNALMDAVDELVADARPPSSAQFSTPDVRRLFVGLYRVLYEIDERHQTITVIVVHRTR